MNLELTRSILSPDFHYAQRKRRTLMTHKQFIAAQPDWHALVFARRGQARTQNLNRIINICEMMPPVP